MNWIKRAFRSISYHKKNTILMFLSFLILSILILFGLCIRAASRERIWEIRTSIGGSVLVSNERQIYSEEPRGVNSISHQKYLELCADERIRFGSCNTVTAALADNFTAEIMDGQEENGTENIYVEGSSDPVEYFSSVSSVVTLISGHVPQNAEEAVVSDGIAERNGLGIGDTIAVLSPYTKERYTFKISRRRLPRCGGAGRAVPLPRLHPPRGAGLRGARGRGIRRADAGALRVLPGPSAGDGRHARPSRRGAPYEQGKGERHQAAPRRCAQGQASAVIARRHRDNAPCKRRMSMRMQARSIHDILPTEIAVGCRRAKMM